MRTYTCNLPALGCSPIFPLVTYTAQQVQPISKLFEGNTFVLSEGWRPFASSFEKKLRV